MNLSLPMLALLLCLIGLPVLILGLVVVKGVGSRLETPDALSRRTQGKIVSLERTPEGPVRFLVDYQAQGQTYQLTEWAQMEWDSLKLGPLSLSRPGAWANGLIQEGDDVWVRYDPKNPSQAVIEGYDPSLRPDRKDLP